MRHTLIFSVFLFVRPAVRSQCFFDGRPSGGDLFFNFCGRKNCHPSVRPRPSTGGKIEKCHARKVPSVAKKNRKNPKLRTDVCPSRIAPIWMIFGQNRSHRLQLSSLKCSRIVVVKKHTKFTENYMSYRKCSPTKIVWRRKVKRWESSETRFDKI